MMKELWNNLSDDLKFLLLEIGLFVVSFISEIKNRDVDNLPSGALTGGDEEEKEQEGLYTAAANPF